MIANKIRMKLKLSFLLITGSTNSIPITTRATSNATLLSEVISMTKLRPHMNPRNKHIRLRESVDCESAAEGIKGDNRATLA